MKKHNSRVAAPSNQRSGEPVAGTSAQQRASRQSAAARIHGNKAYCKSVTELLQRHSKLIEYAPAEADRPVFRFGKGRRRGVLMQTHVRFRFDYPTILTSLLDTFDRLFAFQGSKKDPFEVVVTFNAILHCNDTKTYSIFYGTDHRQNNYMGSARELSFGETYVIRNLSEVAANVPVQFDMQDLLHRHRNAFPNSNVSVFRILNIVYLIYQFREE